MPLTYRCKNDTQAGRDRPAIEVTPAMLEAGRLAMRQWYEGCQDFEKGALAIFSAMTEAYGFQFRKD
jgi:hypothetical protein